MCMYVLWVCVGVCVFVYLFVCDLKFVWSCLSSHAT